jgi:hypothetical protein
MTGTNKSPQPDFTRKSETESICMFCFLTIRADRSASLECMEDIHADVCLGKPGAAAASA